MNKICFEQLNNNYINQLNTWINKEKQLGQNGLQKFIVGTECLLGDFLNYAIEKLDDAEVYVAVQKQTVIGFLCTTKPSFNHMYIEYIGVAPHMQGKGVAGQIIAAFKEQIAPALAVEKITIDAKKSNKAACKAFAKVGKIQEKQDNSGYIGFEL